MNSTENNGDDSLSDISSGSGNSRIKSQEEILARKQYEDVVKNSRPFWYINLITLHPKKLLSGLFTLYFAATFLTV
jgi:hypothetical protein